MSCFLKCIFQLGARQRKRPRAEAVQLQEGRAPRGDREAGQLLQAGLREQGSLKDARHDLQLHAGDQTGVQHVQPGGMEMRAE